MALQKHCWVVPMDRQKSRVLSGFGGSLGAPETQLLQCEAVKWHITSACSAVSAFPSGFCILALELGALPGISAAPRSCSLFTAKFSVEIPAGKAYGRLKNVTWSNEKIHEASVMLPLAWTNVWFSISLGGCLFGAELSQLWGAFRRDLWPKVAPCSCSRPERRIFVSEAVWTQRLLQKDAEQSLSFHWPSQWELGTSLPSKDAITTVTVLLLCCSQQLMASCKSRILLVCLSGIRWGAG